MNELTKFLVESILAEAETGITVLIPGGFKPPHGGHLDLVKRYASQPNVTEVKILVGPESRDGVTREDSIAIWKLLTGGLQNVSVTSVNENSPLLAAYKFIETAKPGTYALGSSGKDKDYQRVATFVNGHKPGSKYARAGVNVVELPINVQPVLYKDREDQNKGKGISASILRQDIQSQNYNNFKTSYPGTPETILRSIYDILTRKLRENKNMILEGGAAGHLAHPFEDYDLTFDDIKNMIDLALSGKIESAQEKLDGQNLMVTYKDGQVRAARNKGQVKNFGANSLTTKQVEDMFANRGPIQAAFSEAMKDLETAINKLSVDQKKRFFGNGSKFVNLEVLYPATANVVPYGASQLRLHNITEYDEAGNAKGTDQEAARQLQGAIRQVEAENQKTYEIRVTDPLTIKKSADYEKQKKELMALLANMQSKFKLKGSDKVGLYFQGWWKEYIQNQATGYQYKVPADVLQQLVNRWAFSNKEVNIKSIRDGIQNDNFKNWVTEFDKKDLAAQKKIAAKPLEGLFLKLGVFTLRNVENLVALNPNQSIRAIKKDLKQSIEGIKKAADSAEMEDDGAALAFLKRELSRLQDLGGFDAILPTEGLVFKYQGKLYKLTGAFAPINQILGYLKF